MQSGIQGEFWCGKEGFKHKNRKGNDLLRNGTPQCWELWIGSTFDVLGDAVIDTHIFK